MTDKSKIANFVEMLRQPITIDILNGNVNTSTSMMDTSNVKNPIPVICIINGAGGNGKDTFVEAVGKSVAAFNISSIDTVKKIAGLMANSTASMEGTMLVKPNKEIGEKSNKYRKFLSDLKRVWTEYCDGPTYDMLSQVSNLIKRQAQGMEHHDIIFLHIREPENIVKMKELVDQLYGAICITVLVTGLVDPSQYDNESDRNVENYAYDLTVVNKPGDLQGFKERAALFGRRIAAINRAIGISMPDVSDGGTDKPAGE